MGGAELLSRHDAATKLRADVQCAKNTNNVVMSGALVGSVPTYCESLGSSLGSREFTLASRKITATNGITISGKVCRYREAALEPTRLLQQSTRISCR